MDVSRSNSPSEQFRYRLITMYLHCYSENTFKVMPQYCFLKLKTYFFYLSLLFHSPQFLQFSDNMYVALSYFWEHALYTNKVLITVQ